MSALARYFAHQNCQVAGYDRTPSSLTGQLQQEGITVHFNNQVDDAPAFLLNQPGETLVIYTPAIGTDNPILAYLSSHDYPVVKRSTVLGQLSREFYTIAVGGAHGKTSTSAFIAHALTVSDIPFYGLLGGISTNYHTNFLAPPAGQAPRVMVTEADEYDRSFLALAPDVSVLTSTDADHLDIYQSAEALQEAYQAFAGQTKAGGLLIHPPDFPVPEGTAEVETYSFGINQGDFQASDITIENKQYQFRLVTPTASMSCRTAVPGRHNLLNMTAACAALHQLLSPEALQKAMQSYAGVKRRFEVIVQEGRHVLIDDYAHHPAELAYTIQTLRELYPSAKVTGFFQPHLYSRTRDFADQFAKTLAALDEVVLLPVYPAREAPIPGVSSALIYNRMDHPHAHLLDRSDAPGFLERGYHEVVVTLGAGDISDIVNEFAEKMKAKAQL